MASGSIPNFGTKATQRAVVTGAVATGLGIFVVVPLMSKTLNLVTTQLKSAGFLPSA